MIWYSFEIVLLIGLIAAGVLVYAFLIHSPAFARFLNRLTTSDLETAEEELDAARESTAEILAQARKDVAARSAKADRLQSKL